MGGEFPKLETLLTTYVAKPKSADDLRSALFAWLGSPPAKKDETPNA